MTKEDQRTLISDEVKRWLKEYRENDVCWQELSQTIYPVAGLTVRDIIELWAEISAAINGDVIKRYDHNGAVVEILPTEQERGAAVL